MTEPKRGYGQGGQARKGVLAQRPLLITLKRAIDEAGAKGAGLTRDNARRELRELRTATNWNTPYILQNLGTARCKYLRSIGWPVPTSRLFAGDGDVERITAWSEREHS